MMLMSNLRLILCCIVFIQHAAALAQPASHVTLYCHDGSVRDAVLLYSSDTALYADLSMQSWERQTVPPLDDVFVFRPADLDSVLCHGAGDGVFRRILGGFFGAILGFFPGVLVGGGFAALAAPDDEETAYGIAFAGAVGGMIIGGIVGAAPSDDDLPSCLYSTSDTVFPRDLQRYCLYKDKLPRFLHAIALYPEQSRSPDTH
jgi:hypothetical protein